MATIQTIKSSVNSSIRSQTAKNSISQNVVATRMDNILDEVKNRGILVVSSTAALQTTDPSDSLFYYVDGYAVFQWKNTGTANGITIFSANGNGFWHALSTSLDFQDTQAYSSASVDYTITSQYLLYGIIIIPSANSTIDIGSSNGGNQYYEQVDLVANVGQHFGLTIYASSATHLYISGLPATSTIIYLLKRIKTS